MSNGDINAIDGLLKKESGVFVPHTRQWCLETKASRRARRISTSVRWSLSTSWGLSFIFFFGQNSASLEFFSLGTRTPWTSLRRTQRAEEQRGKSEGHNRIHEWGGTSLRIKNSVRVKSNSARIHGESSKGAIGEGRTFLERRSNTAANQT